MRKLRFLFLTNINETFPALLDFSNQFPERFNFILHSPNEFDTHRKDLRNHKAIQNLIDDNTVIIFYLTGYLGIYIVEEFFRKFNRIKNKIVFVYSSENLFLPRDSSPNISTKQIIDIIKSKSENYLFLSALFPGNNYKDYLKTEDKQTSEEKMNFSSFLIPDSELINEIIRISGGRDTNKTLYLLNSNYIDAETFLTQKNFGLGKFWEELTSNSRKTVTKRQRKSAILAFLKTIPSLNKDKVNFLYSENLEKDFNNK